jgi:hypothetical protein
MATDCLIPTVLAQLAQASPTTHGIDSGTWIGLLIATVATGYIYVRAKRKAKRDPLETHASSASLSQQRAVERQMSNLLVELSEMARTVSATIDTRAAKLEVLIDDADKRIETLRALGATIPSNPQQSMQITPVVPVMRQIEHAPEIVAAVAATRVTTADERHTRVYELADQGQTLHEIATTLGRPSGEIELILALRSRDVTAKAS